MGQTVYCKFRKGKKGLPVSNHKGKFVLPNKDNSKSYDIIPGQTWMCEVMKEVRTKRGTKMLLVNPRKIAEDIDRTSLFEKLDPSPYQKDFFDVVEEGEQSAAINAVAGSGKTTSILMALEKIPSDKSCIFLAFNKSIVTELEEKIPHRDNIRVQTCHSFGMKHMTEYFRSKLKRSKYWDMLTQMIKNGMVDVEDIENVPAYKMRVKQLCELYRMSLCDGIDELEALADKHGIIVENGELQITKRLVEMGKRDVENIDFTDMIYLPIEMDLPISTFDIVFIDEAQDLNACQRKLMIEATGSDGKFYSLGDRKQAIYGFSGADHNSYNKLVELADTELPLSICYRCDKKIIEKAQEIVPHIEPREDADEGEFDPEASIADIQEGDMVLCQPPGTKILMVGGEEKNIEELKVGDRVISYDSKRTKAIGVTNIKNPKRLSNFGREVKETSSRDFNGKLINVELSSGHNTSYTPGHRCLARFSKDIEGKHVTYLLRKGNRFRIGVTRFLLSTGRNSSAIGPTVRMKHEGADCYWILSVNEDREQAIRDEQFFSIIYGIPQTKFSAHPHMDAKTIESIYSRIESNTNLESNASKLLSSRGLDIENPFNNTNQSRGFGGRSAHFEVYASNLMEEYMMMGFLEDGDKRPRWAKISSIRRTPYNGKVIRLGIEKDRKYFGDRILTHNCRTNYPLSRLFMKLIRKGMKAHIMGKDIGKNLVNMIRSTRKREIVDALKSLYKDLEKKKQKIAQRKKISITKVEKTSAYRYHKEKIDVIEVLSEGLSTCKELTARIDDIFRDSREEGVTLSTVHKAKGLESDRVFIIHKDLLPADWAEKAWEKEQEMNLLYVAITRAKHHLGYVTDFDAYAEKRSM